MTEKRFTRKEVNKGIYDVLESYIQLYKDGNMTFLEYAVIENIGMKLSDKFKKMELGLDD